MEQTFCGISSKEDGSAIRQMQQQVRVCDCGCTDADAALHPQVPHSQVLHPRGA